MNQEISIDRIRSCEELLAYIAEGGKPRYLSFWGHTQKYLDQIDKSCLSNWYPSPFTRDGWHYPTAEHYMMAQKAALFGDEATQRRILEAYTPDEAKKLGRLVRNFDEAVWRERRFDIVTKGCLAKFQQNPAMRNFLLSTGDQVLVETSPRDLVWGIGFLASEPQWQQPRNWRGLNLLGFVLMEVRQRLLEQ
ncbi:NADAR family protein [Cerasicoccus maritimus]|uniref:NADAR family protein n=1 Tax=Cerasicoccus maritimus TaxID=490089 RepID=UPI002852981E|nr:NADAR family protein [Cerasicoccus maritimus]